MSTPCQGCGASVDCPETDDYSYTLTADPAYPFVPVCPQGYSCQPTPGSQYTVYLTCCSHQLSAIITGMMTQSDINAIMQGLLAQCQQYAGECVDPPPAPGTPPPGTTTLYWNAPQTAKKYCPDCTVLSYTVPAGRFTGTSQIQANTNAYEYAFIQVSGMTCPTPTVTTLAAASTGTAYSASASVAGLAGTYSVIGGALPPGLSLNSTTGAITGTPTTPGTFSFTIQLSYIA